MKIQSAIAAVSVASMMMASSAQADDINSVVSVEGANNVVQVNEQVQNDRVNIQDYIDAARQGENKVNKSVAGQFSRWQSEGVL